MAERAQPAGSASLQGTLWSAQARHWAQLQEATARPVYEAVLRKLDLGAGQSLIDVGCGAGMFCEMAARRGLRVTGLDAAPSLIEIARERVPDADFHVGEIEGLPFADHTFDVVTGFNSFQYAANRLNALREARRVAKPGSAVVIATWGNPQDSDAAKYLAALRSLLPAPPPGAPGPFELYLDSAVATISAAGLAHAEMHEVDCPFEYPDLETAIRALLSAGPAVRAIQTAGEPRVREAVTEVLAPHKNLAGGYRLKNTFRYLITIA